MSVDMEVDTTIDTWLLLPMLSTSLHCPRVKVDNDQRTKMEQEKYDVHRDVIVTGKIPK
jgi:hypothetical protein